MDGQGSARFLLDQPASLPHYTSGQGTSPGLVRVELNSLLRLKYTIWPQASQRSSLCPDSLRVKQEERCPSSQDSWLWHTNLLCWWQPSSKVAGQHGHNFSVPARTLPREFTATTDPYKVLLITLEVSISYYNLALVNATPTSHANTTHLILI